MKKQFCVFLVLVYILGFCRLVFSQSNQVEILLLDATGSPGQTDVAMGLRLSSPNSLSPVAVQLEIEFDSSILSFNSIQDGAAATQAGKNASAQLISSNVLRVLVVGLNQNRIGNGELARILWNIQPNAPGGAAALVSCRNLLVSDLSGGSLPSRCTDARVNISGGSSSSCDLNGDGQIDVVDVQLGSNAILGSGQPFDLDCDNTTTVSDLQILINIILNPSLPCPSCGATTTLPGTTTTTTSTSTTTTTTTTTTTSSSTSTTVATTSTTTTSTTSTTTTSTTSTSSTTTTTIAGNSIGYSFVSLQFNPNPVPGDGTGRHSYGLTITEINGVGVNLTSLFIAGDPANRLNDFFPSTRLNSNSSQSTTVITTFQTPINSPVDRLFEFAGTDDLGHELTWRGTVRLVPFAGAAFGHLEVSLVPNPVSPDFTGRWSFVLQVEETGGVGVNLTGLTAGGFSQNLTTLLGTVRVEAGQTVTRNLFYPAGFTTGDLEWVFTGDDDNGHTGLTWQAIHRILTVVQLISGVPQSGAAQGFGFVPFQYCIYVPAGATSLTIRLDGPASPLNFVNMYVRGGQQVGNITSNFPFNPTADFALTDLGTSSLVVDSNSSPPLQTDTNYYVAIAGTATDINHNFTITATVTGGGGVTTTTTTTTTQTTTSTTTTTSASTSTTSVGTTTTSSTTTTTAGSRPPFAPNIVLNFSTLAAGTIPTVNFDYSQVAGELNVRLAVLEFDGGRADLSNLTPGKVVGEDTVTIPNFGQTTVQHVVVTNDGTTVTTVFQTSFLGSTIPLANGVFNNTGADGVRLVVETRNPIPFPDDTTANTDLSFRFPVGSIFILPTTPGRTFTAVTTFTSVSFEGSTTSVQRSQSFTTQ